MIKNVIVVEVNCEFSMIKPLKLREDVEMSIRTNANLMGKIFPYIFHSEDANVQKRKSHVPPHKVGTSHD